jgi:dCMP deaminase
MLRRDKHNYYLDVSETILKRASCLRRKFGAVIVKNDEVISSGYNGSPRGRANCIDLGECAREKNEIPRGERYELCRSVHAEANAIIHASRRDMLGSTLYLVGIEVSNGSYVKEISPCAMCKKLIINAGIKNVIMRENFEKFVITDSNFWVINDETTMGVMGY